MNSLRFATTANFMDDPYHILSGEKNSYFRPRFNFPKTSNNNKPNQTVLNQLIKYESHD